VADDGHRDRRARRDRTATEAKILDAVGELLARDGYGALGVNAIAREAGVDKVLIYRYFGGLPELLRTYGERSDVWSTVEEAVGGDIEEFRSLPVGLRLARVLKNYGRGLRARPTTLEIMAWELVEDTELTEALNERRLEVTEDLVEALHIGEASPEADAQVLLTLLGAGQLLLTLWARRRPTYGGIGIRAEADLKRIDAALDWMLETLLPDGLQPPGGELNHDDSAPSS
jgi:AcrR family transcriptional regulator